ncbi:hypothetical protein N0V82_000604 [Gnomoniopsis sp. IMI 355080]|nr:hypothetical protein N0V82_000604 [Gnomoniopsis sp. IMI 355080]
MVSTTRSFVASVAVLASTALGQNYSATVIYSGSVSWENAVLRPNGQLLMVSLSEPYVYNLDPSADSPEAVVVATLPGVDSTQGIALVGDDKYAVSAGITGSNSLYTNETIFTIDMSTASSNGTVEPEFVLMEPSAENFNGLLSLDSDPNVVLLGDSLLGKVWRVDIASKTISSPIEDELMAVPVNTTFSPALGIDGLKLWTNTTSGQLYLYFTNVAALSLARVPINANATAATGPAELVDTFEDPDNWDDMAIAQSSGLIFGAMNPNYICMVEIATGAAEVVINDTAISEGPTAVVLKGDGHTGWAFARGGEVLELELPAY